MPPAKRKPRHFHIGADSNPRELTKFERERLAAAEAKRERRAARLTAIAEHGYAAG